MRSRIAVTAMLALGLFASTSGAGLAVSGFVGDGATSAQVQYQTPSNSGTQPTLGGGEVQGEAESGGPSTGSGNSGNAGSGGTSPASSGSHTAPSTAREQGSGVANQVAAQSGGGTLPFTGWAAIPVLVLGLALVATGVILRRSTGSTRAG